MKTLLNDDFPKGFHSAEWQGIDDNGKKAGSGVYFYVIKTDKYPALIKKCLILK
ncbi:MAG: hypothetical protein CSB55_07200 [Candidatus Cloacimonadota bacterium]|nr:MAG: hypothetical protein CSB55_07200 [Candidatus Cloacimonadota bacterium]